MENITLGQIATALGFLIALISSVSTIAMMLKKTVSKVIANEIKPIKTDIEDIKENHKNDKLDRLKTDLVNFMSLAEKEDISTEQKINAHELYDAYCGLGGNSYIHDKWENLKKEGKI